MALEIGPTQGQERALRELGHDPNQFQDHDRKAIFAFIQGEMNKGGGQEARRGTNLTAQNLLARQKIIEQQGFAPGMTVLITYKGKEMRRVIEEISPNCYIRLKGRAQLFPPQALKPLIA